ncbi:unnamed protein product [Prunus armeniaca]|uniref:Uncharacterized protein n=1 Tax=Prunus armeniaca TaxID=36596 RepID=A0A6J5XU13_PRUAR|nr:unnamed protein product [Prunus armeniaca]
MIILGQAHRKGLNPSSESTQLPYTSRPCSSTDPAATNILGSGRKSTRRRRRNSWCSQRRPWSPSLLSKRNQRGISFKLPMLSAYVANDVVKEISDGNTTTLSLRFGLKLSVWSRYRAQLMSDQKTPLPRFASYFCDRIHVRVSSDNNHINDTGNLKIITKAHQSTACDISSVMFD